MKPISAALGAHDAADHIDHDICTLAAGGGGRAPPPVTMSLSARGANEKRLP
jgi:hypothetical protein